MKEAFYFPHDCNAISDPKIMQLLSKCGMAGVGLYWVIIEILHSQEDGMISEDAFKDYIKFYGQYSYKGTDWNDEFEQVLNKTQLLLNKDGFVFSKRVLQNKFERKKLSEIRSLAGKKSGVSRSKYKDRTNVQQNSTNVEQNLQERKGKEIKGKDIYIEREFTPQFKPTLEGTILYFKMHGFSEPERQGELCYNYYGESKFVNERAYQLKCNSWNLRKHEFAPKNKPVEMPAKKAPKVYTKEIIDQEQKDYIYDK